MNTMLDELISPLHSILENKFLLFILISLVIIGSIWFIKNKAKSGFSISDRFFKFWTGYDIESNNDLLSDIKEVEKFNYDYNMNAMSKRQKNSFESWVKKYELDFKVISKLKFCFSIEYLKVKKIHVLIPLSLFFLLIIIAFIFSTSTTIAVKPAGLIKFDDTGWFWFNSHEAVEYNFIKNDTKDWLITKEQCDKGEFSVRFSKYSIGKICNSFNNKISIDYINNLIKKQRWLFGFISAFLFLASIYLFSKIITILISYDARKMIYLKINKYRKNRN